jgi:hypothetical protein
MSPIVSTLANASARGFRAFNLAPNGFESIASVTVDSSADPFIEFTNIPSTYAHLQIRGIIRTDGGGPEHSYFRFGTGGGSVDAGSNYSSHILFGDGSTAQVENYANSNKIEGPPVDTNANQFAGVVVDILDYANIDKYKTLRSYGGFPEALGGYLFATGGTWRNTAAIDRIRFFANSQNIAQYSQLALYGIGKA